MGLGFSFLPSFALQEHSPTVISIHGGTHVTVRSADISPDLSILCNFGSDSIVMKSVPALSVHHHMVICEAPSNTASRMNLTLSIIRHEWNGDRYESQVVLVSENALEISYVQPPSLKIWIPPVHSDCAHLGRSFALL